jgi:CDP-diacylglycerol---serine O-phosphatidyltransferase
MLAQTRLNAK